MGIFHDMETVINLAPAPRTVTFDGQSIEIPPGESQLPRVVISHAKNQNPIFGTADMDNPNISGAKYFIVVKGEPGARTEPFTEEEYELLLGLPSRFNIDEFFADHLGPKEKVVTRGKGRKVQARSSFDAGVRVNSPEPVPESV